MRKWRLAPGNPGVLTRANPNRPLPPALNPVLYVAALWFLLCQVAIAAEIRNVLVLYSNNRLVPGNVAVDRGVRAERSRARPAAGADLLGVSRPARLRRRGLRSDDDDLPAREVRRAAAGRDRRRVRQRGRLPAAPSRRAVPGRSRSSTPRMSQGRTCGRSRRCRPMWSASPIEYDFCRHHRAGAAMAPGCAAAVRGDRHVRARPRMGGAAAARSAFAVAGGRAVEFLAGLSTASLQQRLAALGRRTRSSSRPATTRTARAAFSIRATRSPLMAAAVHRTRVRAARHLHRHRRRRRPHRRASKRWGGRRRRPSTTVRRRRARLRSRLPRSRPRAARRLAADAPLGHRREARSRSTRSSSSGSPRSGRRTAPRRDRHRRRHAVPGRADRRARWSNAAAAVRPKRRGADGSAASSRMRRGWRSRAS